MHLKEVIEGVPIYQCETPAVKYREVWHGQLCEEIALHLQILPEGTLLRGSHAENFYKVAREGTDILYGNLIYVVPFDGTYSIYYPFERAATGMLFYRSSGLVEVMGDKENMNVDFNRYQFIVSPKEALLGIIDLTQVRRKSKRLRTWNRI